MMIALSIGLLAGGAVYLILQRGMIRIVFGFVLMSNAVNLLIITSGGTSRRRPAFAGEDIDKVADSLPQAFVLTAIVISFAVTVFLLTLSAVLPNDDTNDDDEQLETSLIKERPRQDRG